MYFWCFSFFSQFLDLCVYPPALFSMFFWRSCRLHLQPLLLPLWARLPPDRGRASSTFLFRYFYSFLSQTMPFPSSLLPLLLLYFFIPSSIPTPCTVRLPHINSATLFPEGHFPLLQYFLKILFLISHYSDIVQVWCLLKLFLVR